MNLEEDLDIFTKGEFSIIAVVTSATSSRSEVQGIFDDNYQAMFGLASQQAEGRNYCLKVQTQEVEGLRQGDLLKIRNKKYQIVSLQPTCDGKITDLILKEDFS